MIEKSLDCEVKKVDETQGVVIGYGIICLQKNDKGEFVAYEDLQGDHITEGGMTTACHDFMKGDRIAKAQHTGEPVGKIVEGFGVTKDIAKALGWEVPRTGFVLKMKPDSPEILEKYRKGEFTGFSLGGHLTI